MSRRMCKLSWIAITFIVAGLIVLAGTIFAGSGSGKLDQTAQEMGRKLEDRMAILDKAISDAMAQDPATWMQLENLPEDMVLYRYVEDTLQSWDGQFPVRNDDIRPRAIVQRLGENRSQWISPLSDVGPKPSFVNYGPKWFVVKAVEEGNVKVIAGLEIVNELRPGSINGVNRNFHLAEAFSVRPLSNSTGATIDLDGIPLFKLTAETVAESQHHSALTWLAVALMLIGLHLMLRSRPGWITLAVVGIVQAGILTGLYIYGRQLEGVSQLFSPLLYAGSPFLNSLGAVVIVNLAINVAEMDLYLMRWTALKAIMRKGKTWIQILSVTLISACVALIVIYTHFTFRSIVVNSSIILELYKISILSRFTWLVYASFLALTMSIPGLLQILSPILRSLAGIRYNMFSSRGRIAYALVTGVYFVVASSLLGFEKEQQRVDVWANRLAMDRDIALEIQLRSVEGSIAEDHMVGALSAMDGSIDIIRSRIISNYMSRIAQDYDIDVMLPGAELGAAPLFQQRIRGGIRLGENSHFFYNALGGGRTGYTGLFTYYIPGHGASSILLTVESKHNREDRGYLRLLGISDPGRVSLPASYSWAKYAEGRLFQYKGAYPYPTVNTKPAGIQHEVMSSEGWTHFVHQVSDEETVVISRPKTEWLYYIVEGFIFGIVAFCLASITTRRRRTGGRRYYQRRIGLVINLSLLLTLVAMAIFSIWFLNKRNNADMQSIMTSRVNSLQLMMQERLRQIQDPEEIATPEVAQAVEEVGNNLRCDISLFDTDGRVVMSTTPEVYDRMILGQRLSDRAFYNIQYAHKRIFINQENAGRRQYYALYAPVFNSSGRMVAIVSSPFIDLTTDLQSQIIVHIATVITIFLLLLMISRAVTSEVVSRMFGPISELRRKMTVTDVDHLEPLQYDQDDEITPLVDAYNRMVHDLGESSRRLAQVERDKAWTDMARRVAHDLKNPLTPIKLQLQMLMRMKQSGNPAWQERFDEVAATVLYHVDLLADSADQFSTFAKMYDQSPERLDLDSLVKQEVDLFDSRDDVSLEYLGLTGAWVNAPRPQLTRVVVNLITNAIQAVEANEGPRNILVQLRNASEDGYYEVVVEDNGPGVSEQYQDKIFTPDFTTKTSGSGLGLAICKRIVEHCGGSISYSRSFTLGGACFTVKYPKA